MKKFFSLFLMLVFISSQNLVFSATSTQQNFRTINNETRKQNMLMPNQTAQSQTQAGNIQTTDSVYQNTMDNGNVLNNTEPVSNAFSNNYQNPNKPANVADLSVIEQIFNGKEVDISNNVLRQVGYDFFNFPLTQNISTTGKYDSTYKLSIGEKVSAYMYGDSADVIAISGSNLLTPVSQTEVDSSGNLFLPGIGYVPAEGKTLAETESAMNRLAANKYKNLKISLSISAGQDMSVFVYGQVYRPGKVYINNNSSIIDAIGAAGGIKKSGTLRNITYTSGKKTYKVDLYNTIFLGNDSNIILKPNDKIFVSNVGNVIAIKNGVTIPGIYESKDNDSLQNIVNYAGGLLPGVQKSELTLTRLDDNNMERKAENIVWEQAKSTKIHNGDTVEFRELYNTAENIVILQGNVKHPATYAYKEGMRLSDILPNEKELLEETFISQAVIRRISGKDNTIETIPIFLKEFFSGANDPLLQPKDVINVYKNTNSEYVDIYGCISTPKHVPYTDEMKLEDILTDIQFVESNLEGNDENLKDVAIKTDENGAVLMGSTENNNKLIPAEEVAVEIIGQDDSIQVYYLYDIMISSYKLDTITLMPNDKIFFRKLRDDEKIKNVKITGFVKNPSSFKFVRGYKLKDIIEKAGGLEEDADLRGIVYTRKTITPTQVDLAQKNYDRDINLIEGKLASGFKQSANDMNAKSEMIEQLKDDKKTINGRYDGRIVLNIKSNDLNRIRKIDNVEVQDGDSIYIPRRSRHVSIIGEVYNEQSFIYREGQTFRKYKKEVGGYTPNAAWFRVYKVGVNGRAQRVHTFSRIAEGDTIIVPRRVAGNDWITPLCSTLSSLASIISTAFIVTKI